MSRSGWLGVSGGLTSAAIVICGSIKSGVYWIVIGMMFVVWGVAYNIWAELRKKRTKQQSLGGRSE